MRKPGRNQSIGSYLEGCRDRSEATARDSFHPLSTCPAGCATALSRHSVGFEPLEHFFKHSVFLAKPLHEQTFQPAVLFIKRGKVATCFGRSDNRPAANTTTSAHQALALRAALARLPDDPSLYFDLGEPHVMIPLGQLVNARARDRGIINANRHMLAAAKGNEKRKPLTVRPLENALWLVMDGNSTLLNARHSKWQTIPCRIE